VSELTIDRLSATIHPIPGVDDPRRGVARMLSHLAGARLDEGIDRLGLPSGHWCVRRVDATVELDPSAPEATTESRWAEALFESLKRALVAPPGDVVHYRSSRDARVDLAVSLAVGRRERAWAWRQAGVTAFGDPPAATDPVGAFHAAMERAPDDALRATVVAARTAGVAALHRLLGATGWARLALVVARSAGASDAVVARLCAEASTPRVTPGPGLVPPAVRIRASQVLSRSAFVVELARSGVRPGTEVTSWAVLAIAEADPAALRTATADRMIAAVAAQLRPDQHRPVVGLMAIAPSESVDRLPGATPRPNRTVDARSPVADDAVAAAGGPTGRAEPATGVTGPAEAAGGDVAEDPGWLDEDVRPRYSTVWGGLLFLLTTAEGAGILELLDDPRLESRSVRWVLSQLALLLVPIASDDPAARAFAGLLPDAQPPGGAARSEEEERALVDAASRWARETALRMAQPEADPFEVVARVARRRGEVVAEPGWMEVHLDLGDVDVEIRTAGLDIDPGWIPWLGVVVRFVYG
jgi:hypothetical protein